MPRARTQSGSAICAASVSELAVEIQAMPTTTIAGTASHSVGDEHDGDRRRRRARTVPQRTNWSRPMRWRSRGRYSAATIGADAHRRQQQREGAGAAAVQAARHQRQQRDQRGRLQEEQEDAQQQHLAHARRLHARAAGRRASRRGSARRAARWRLRCALPAQDQHEGDDRQHRVEHEHRGAAGAGQQRAGHHRADDARQVHRDAVQRQRRRQLVRAARPPARWPRTPASASPGRCRWRRSAPAAAARQRTGERQRRPAPPRSTATHSCVAAK